jgi:hypothetical protein
MAEMGERPAPRRAWYPWWIDPYSDNPIAFGVLFLLTIVGLLLVIIAVRVFFVHDPGAHPIEPPSNPLGVARALASVVTRL